MNELDRRNVISIRLPQWIIDWLRIWQLEQQKSFGKLIEEAIKEYYSIDKN